MGVCAAIFNVVFSGVSMLSIPLTTKSPTCVDCHNVYGAPCRSGLTCVYIYVFTLKLEKYSTFESSFWTVLEFIPQILRGDRYETSLYSAPMHIYIFFFLFFLPLCLSRKYCACLSTAHSAPICLLVRIYAFSVQHYTSVSAFLGFVWRPRGSLDTICLFIFYVKAVGKAYSL